ncbi:MAG: diaminopimelate epimerase [Bacillota bacterium]
MEFEKYQGLGNDFILFDGREPLNGEDYAGLARRICHRNLGAGADGLVVVLPSANADWTMRIFNPDGSEAEMCGNGIRCFARYLVDHGLNKGKEIKVDTLAGVKTVEIIGQADNFLFEVDMGEPILETGRIPVALEVKTVINEPFRIDGELFAVTCVSMGNPHCVIFVPDAEKFPVATWGPRIERAVIFPHKTNVEFVEIYDRQRIRMRVWERGAGVTLACGTGACASVAAGVLNGKSDRKVSVRLDGGDLEILWDETDNRIRMTGPAERVFTGRFPV